MTTSARGGTRSTIQPLATRRGRIWSRAASMLRPRSTPIDLTPQLRCPLLGLFGAEDQTPSPAHVARMEHELRAHAKTFEFHMFESAGHAFFSVDRPNYRVDAAKEGWKRIWTFFGQHLAGGAS